jgi:hypothetical protein
MRKKLFLFVVQSVPMLFLACAPTLDQSGPETGPPPSVTAPAPGPAGPAAPAPQPPPSAATADFGAHWPGATVRVEAKGVVDNLGAGLARVSFDVEWTRGQTNGVLYPKKFVDPQTQKEVPLDPMWDNGGTIKAGVYDVFVQHDGRFGTGWIRGLRLAGPRQLHVVVDMNAAMLDLPLTTYAEVVVFPAGTYATATANGTLKRLSTDAAISWYNSENKGAFAVAPAGKVDLKVVHAGGKVEWRPGYVLPANTRVQKL